MLLSNQNKIFRADTNHFKENKITLENFAIVRDKTFHAEIRIFLMGFLLMFFNVSFGFSWQDV